MNTSHTKSSLKVCRRADPLLCQRVWDVIKDINDKKRKSFTTKENIVNAFCKAHDTEKKIVEDQIKFMVKDKLLALKTTKVNKGRKKGTDRVTYELPVESEVNLNGKSDWYCFQCHKPGEVLNCVSCPRVYHLTCLESDDTTEEFVCPPCTEVEPDPDVEDEDERRELNLLIQYACGKLNEKLPLEKYDWENTKGNPSSDEEDWRAKLLLRFPRITVNSMRDRADRQVYKTLCQLNTDSAIIVHNVTIFFGVDSSSADAAKTMIDTCKIEIEEIQNCRDCYKRSNAEQKEVDWFTLPCNPAHEVVMAKVKTFLPWPAKNLGFKNKKYHVQFFGKDHQKVFVSETCVQKFTSLPANEGEHWQIAVVEVERYLWYQRHQERLNSSEPDTSTSVMVMSDDSTSSDSPNQYTRPQLLKKIAVLENELKETKKKMTSKDELIDLLNKEKETLNLRLQYERREQQQITDKVISSSVGASMFRTSKIYPYEIGLVNNGNTCYINATLQALFALPGFTEDLVTAFKGTENVIASLLAKMIAARKKGLPIEVDKINEDLVKNLWMLHPSYSVREQQDASEFLIRLIEHLQLALPAGPINPVESHFEWQMIEMVHCTACGKKKQRVQKHTSICLPMPEDSRNLEQCLEDYMAVEERELACSSCEATTTMKSSIFKTLPRKLIISVNRYSKEAKLAKHIVPPQVLDIQPYLENLQSQRSSVYTLAAQIVHIGRSKNSGHYVSHVCCEDGVWRCYSDDSVKTVSIEDEIESVDGEPAYVYFYVHQF